MGTLEEHDELLDEVLQRLIRNNLKVHADKCKFCCYEAEFLGFHLTREGIKPQQNKIEAILALQPPTNVRQVRSFLGFINYYKVFIPHRSGLLAPISNLVKKSTKFLWTPDCDKAFSTIKSLLGRQVVLAYPNFKLPFEIHTDASTSQLGSVIHQDGRPIAFYSRKLTDAQSRYTITELELLSIVETLQEFRTVLLGHDIVVYTDHKNLTFDNFTTDRVRRWRLIVEEYGPRIIYVKGCTNTVADFLSRYPQLSSSVPVEELQVFDADDLSASFPLAYEVIHNAQQNDADLLRISTTSPGYTTRIHNRLPIIFYKGFIVVPTTLRPSLIQWYHDTLCHPGSFRTLKTIQAHFH
jgi:hypothetical protein